VVEKPKITRKHNDHARIPTVHVGDCPRRRYLHIPNKNEEYEAQAIPKVMCSSQNAIRLSWHDLSLTYVGSNSCKAESQQEE
jgi:hypothetical protein